ncbi:HD domain-containing protein [Longimicrobium sp.]|uniref:HD domain-containing protein n=1 Tax=Longimicrobium sp. TaxID=2029185 RepID=UPI002E324556|nr:HD domain-containing protein [Longimicrobium sp.]
MTSEPGLGPVARAAARGELPDWARASEKRRAHIGRVAALLGEWARGLGLSAAEQERWLAAGWLHDVLREAPPEELRPLVPEAFRALPPKLLHGPAAAERLAGEADAELLEAIRYHTLGSARFGTLGRALYLADFLEPGRRYEPEWTASLRARMPHDLDAVMRDVVRARVRHVEESGSVLHPETRALYEQVQGA